MPDIKIDDNCLLKEIRRVNVYLNSDELEQLENQQADIDKRWAFSFGRPDCKNSSQSHIVRVYGDHAPASSTTSRIIMTDSSDEMEFSLTNIEQVAACEKLRDTVTGISALHLSIQGMDGHSPSLRNSFKDLYLSTQAMIRRKEEMVSELKTLPPCTIPECQDHKIPSTSVEEEINFVPSPWENKNENKIKTNSKSKKKFSKKRKQKGKDSTESLSFPKRRPDRSLRP
ncbi:hypothetical protein TNCV_961581 [Trichonephila clavipes]|nr:hypothetical protein TNCV_961581 [Trichonephila clavipes]